MDEICLKRCWGGEVQNVSVLVASGVDADGYLLILGIREGGREDKASWTAFLRELKQRGLDGVSLVISDKCIWLIESIGEFLPNAKWQRCIIHWYCNAFSKVPRKNIVTLPQC